MSLTATSAPSSAKISAMPRPMPRLAPVISAFFPFNFIIESRPECVAELLQVRLADLRRELHVARVDRLHDGVGFLAGFHRAAGVLMQAGGEAHVVDRFTVVV